MAGLPDTAPLMNEHERAIHILLVEDNAGDARLVVEAFRQTSARCHFSHVVNGVEAVEFLRRTSPHTQLARWARLPSVAISYTPLRSTPETAAGGRLAELG